LAVGDAEHVPEAPGRIFFRLSEKVKPSDLLVPPPCNRLARDPKRLERIPEQTGPADGPLPEVEETSPKPFIDRPSCSLDDPEPTKLL
jgi:hypothetical protein